MMRITTTRTRTCTKTSTSACSNNSKSETTSGNQNKKTTMKKTITATATTTTPPDNKRSSSTGRFLLRWFLLDVPMLALWATYVLLMLAEQIHLHYLLPIKNAMEWTLERKEKEVTFYHYACTRNDITATTAKELVIGNNSSSGSSSSSNDSDVIIDDAITKMRIHGASIIPNILSNGTATTLRAFIVRENQRQEDASTGFWVIENEHRSSWGIRIDQDVSIGEALTEIGRHPHLERILSELVGSNPAVIEMTAITSTAGAKTQSYHQDVVPYGSAAKYARSFVPSYSLFIPLQDTSQKMGATDICPGTQLCANDDAGGDDGLEGLCQGSGFSAASATDAGIWPLGYGALINQQTTHRGAAHTDDDANNNGTSTDRVVFIITFAPRPQYASIAITESRMIGQSGSYSLHWSQWGHTWNDFFVITTTPPQSKSVILSPLKRSIAKFMRIVRSLGVYKPVHADWGWDIIPVALMRMSNGDNGYTWDDLYKFVMPTFTTGTNTTSTNNDGIGMFDIRRGGIPFLPTWLQATEVVTDPKYYETQQQQQQQQQQLDDDEPLDGGWYDYIIGTMYKVKYALSITNIIVLMVYVLCLVVVSVRNGIFERQRKKCRQHDAIMTGVSAFRKGICRLLITHGTVVGLAWLLWCRLNNSFWARHIRNGKLFQPYNSSSSTLELSQQIVADGMTENEDTDNESNADSGSIFIPFTLPNRHDVLIDSHYQSRYLASYAHILDYKQPGNNEWRQMIETYSNGFEQMTNEMRDQFCEFLISNVMLKHHRARFLHQIESGHWSELSLPESKLYCEKKLLMDSDPLTSVLLQEIDFLRAETKFGAWRGQAIHRTTIPNYLTYWTHHVLRLRRHDELQRQRKVVQLVQSLKTNRNTGALLALKKPSITPSTLPAINMKTISRMLFVAETVREPFPGAWLRTGDIVEGKYQGIHNEWYRGVLVDVSTDRETFDIMYDDGEEDFDLCRRCVRRFRQYMVGERVEVKVDYDIFVPARISAIHEDDMYDIRFLSSNEIVETVPSADLRRFR